MRGFFLDYDIIKVDYQGYNIHTTIINMIVDDKLLMTNLLRIVHIEPPIPEFICATETNYATGHLKLS